MYTSRVIYSAQYHRQHCTLQALKQLGASTEPNEPSPKGSFSSHNFVNWSTNGVKF